MATANVNGTMMRKKTGEGLIGSRGREKVPATVANADGSIWPVKTGFDQ